MNRETIINTSKKVVRLIVAVKVISLCVKVGMAIKDSIPKYDTFDGIDADLLVEQNTK